MENPKPASTPPRLVRRSEKKAPRTLSFDIGGTGIKAELLDERGRPLTDSRAHPDAEGRHAAPGSRYHPQAGRGRRQGPLRFGGFSGGDQERRHLYRAQPGQGMEQFCARAEAPARAETPGARRQRRRRAGPRHVTGHGVELVITLGTGVGSVVFVNGNRIHLELGHHPFHKGKTYEDELGHRMLLKKGKKWWNKRLREAIEDLKTAFNYDRLYLAAVTPSSSASSRPRA